MKLIYLIVTPFVIFSCAGASTEEESNETQDQEMTNEEVIEIEEKTKDVDETLHELEENSSKATHDVDSLLNNL